jgi:cell wall-associated NlpC family hydrolase
VRSHFHVLHRHRVVRRFGLATAIAAVVVGGLGLPGADAQTQGVAPALAAPARAATTIATPALVSPAVADAAAAENANQISARRAAVMHRAVKAAVRVAKVAAVHSLRMRIVKLAKAQVGDTYSAGRSGPNNFDCSGLTRYLYKQTLGKSLPHYSRAQWNSTQRVRLKNAQPGDLVFFFRHGAHHVGLYIGGGKMVHAAGYGKGVRIAPVTGSWYSRSYSGVGRIIKSV